MVSRLEKHFIAQKPFSEKLQNFAARFDSYLSAHDNLHSSSDIDRPDCRDQLNNFIRHYIAEQCSHSNSISNNPTHLKITPDQLPKPYGSFSIPYRDWADNHPEPTTMTEAMAFVDEYFTDSSFHEALKQVVNEIPNRGYTEAADALSNWLHLCYADEIALKSQKGRYILKASTYGEKWEQTRKLLGLTITAKTFETETACGNALSTAIQAAYQCLEGQPGSFSIVPSRTKVCEGAPVEIEFFRDHMSIKIEHSLFESLYAFLNVYNTRKIATMSAA